MDENLTINEHQNIVTESNTSYDELVMYMDVPHDDTSDIRWLTSYRKKEHLVSKITTTQLVVNLVKLNYQS